MNVNKVSLYQKRRFQLLFQQYSDTIKTVSTLVPGLDKEVVLYDRITVESLVECLSCIGPFINLEQATQFMFDYDSTITGTLDLLDFLEFMSDYVLVLTKAREVAIQHFNENQEQDFIDQFPTINTYLMSLGLEDPGNYLDIDEPISNQIRDSFSLEDPNILKRNVSIHIFAGHGMVSLLRTKKRSSDCIDFQSLDPFIRIKCAGVVQETSIIIDGTHPTWEQTMDLSIEIPTGVITDIQQWVQVQNIEFFLFDSNQHGNIPSSELLAFGSVPLIRVLLATEKPLNQVLNLVFPHANTLPNQPMPRLQISCVDQTLERFSWTKVVDSYLSNEDAWLMKYSDKMKQDLGHLTLRKYPENEKSVAVIVDRIWTLFISTLESLKNLFPLRNFSLVLLDEFNRFRFLCAFCRPIKIYDDVLKKLDQIAAAVANIPFEQTVLAPQWGTNKYVSTDGSFHNKRLASWLIKGDPGSYATETFLGQVAMPSSILVRRRATLIEHAILLCCFFRGTGVEAYVAIGEVKHRPYAWVITIFGQDQRKQYISNECEHYSQHSSKRVFYRSTLYKQTNEHANEYFFEQESFHKLQAVRNENEFFTKHVVLHWDSLSGQCFDASSDTPFDVLTTLFNEENQYFNVQSCCDPKHNLFSWDIKNTERWVPFFTPDLVIRPGQVNFSPPTFINHYPFEMDPVAANHSLVKEFVSLIQLYRKNLLYIPNTLFHSPSCGIIQSLMDQRSIQSDTDTEYANLTGNQITESFQEASKHSSWWYSCEAEDSLKQIITQVIPDRHYFQSHYFRFSDLDTNGIFELLVESGVFDITIPNVMYTIGVEIKTKSFGMVSVRVLIGYITDFLVQELNHLNRI